MPSLNWDIFTNLPGDARHNFETLCRILIRRHYAQYGEFKALAQQPGVEFHLRLKTSCSLGEPGRWYGWQCRWYGLDSGRQIGTTRRNGIIEAIKKSQEVLPELTDWILWTRHPLTKGDQEWFYDIESSGMQLHLWTADDVEGHLSGESEIFRSTFFGDLILTPEFLARLHGESTAPIKERWVPEVYQTVDAEREIQKILVDEEVWSDFIRLGSDIHRGCSELEAEMDKVPSSLNDAIIDLAQLGAFVEGTLQDVHSAIANANLDLLAQILSESSFEVSVDLSLLPRKLRAKQHRTVFAVTNLLADLRSAGRLLKEVEGCSTTQQVAVIAEYGCGKTCLVAQLTSARRNGLAAGILLHGRDLSAGSDLNDLAGKVITQGNRVPSMEALIAAVDSAGRRAGKRIPIAIDGLNEAESPRDWKHPLAAIDSTLARFPYVLLITTLRPEFESDCLPSDANRLSIPGFGEDVGQAVEKYFQYYKIHQSDIDLPLDLLNHPLTLRLFCEVANPHRQCIVGVEDIPGSLTGLFEEYLEASADRICELSSERRRYFPQDVRSAFDEIGLSLWEGRSRSLPTRYVRRRLEDQSRPWNESLVQSLEQGGILLRMNSDDPSKESVSVVHDALGGHLIASAMLTRYGQAGLETLLNEPGTVFSLTGQWSRRRKLAAKFVKVFVNLVPRKMRRHLWSLLSKSARDRHGLVATNLDSRFITSDTLANFIVEPRENKHPLSTDIIRALVGLVPRKLNFQLWPMLDEPMRSVALRDTADIESELLDSDTVDALAKLILQSRNRDRRDLFHRLRHTRKSQSHPLNSAFLDRVLKPMPVSKRDLRWTEWVRGNGITLLFDLHRLEDGWRNNMVRDPSDRLRAQWVKWILTSTVQELRDQATRALYWYGLRAPAELFEITIDSLSINDAYVSERLFAASYGVAVAHQNCDPTFAEHLRSYLANFDGCLTGSLAVKPTNHELVHLYVRGTLLLAQKCYPAELSEFLGCVQEFRFLPAPPIEPFDSSDPRAAEIAHMPQFTFGNLALRRILRGGDPYNNDDANYLTFVGHISGTIWQHGWRREEFARIDRNIQEDAYRTQTIRRMSTLVGYETLPAGSYGDKYAWIGYHNYRGQYEPSAVESYFDRPYDLHIDPSFPEGPAEMPFEMPAWVGTQPEDDAEWMIRGEVPVRMDFLRRESIDGEEGPWILVQGNLDSGSEHPSRRVYAFMTALLVQPELADELEQALPNLVRSHHFGEPADLLTFAGEIPWSPIFGSQDDPGSSVNPYKRRVNVDNDRTIEVEVLSHLYSWESYHSPLNQVSNVPVPSKLFSDVFNLRSVPQGFHQLTPDGRPASKTFGAHERERGDLLYLREELVREYASGRELIWFVRGERLIYPRPDPAPDWLIEAKRSQADIWCLVHRV